MRKISWLILSLVILILLQDYWLYKPGQGTFLLIPLRPPLTKEPEALTLGNPEPEPPVAERGKTGYNPQEQKIAKLKNRLMVITRKIGEVLTSPQRQYLLLNQESLNRVFEYPYWQDLLKDLQAKSNDHRP
jgi:hypothetical protein